MADYELSLLVGAKDTASAVIDKVSNKLDGFGKLAAGVTGVAAGVAAAVGTVAIGIGALAFDTAQDIQSSGRLIQRSLGDSADAAIDYEAVMTSAFGANLGDSLEDLAGTIIEVEQNTERLGGVSESVLSGMVQDAELVQRTFGTDTGASISAATALMGNFGLTGAEAFDFIAKGQQRGLDSAGDLIDTIEEYSPQFKSAGADAGEFFSLLETGIGSGTFLGTDRVADAFGEFRKRILDDSKLTKESLDSLGFNSEQFVGDIASGAVSATDAFEMVTGALGETDDLVAQNVAGVGLLGTQFEDLGVDAIRNIDLTTTSLEDMAGATDSLAGGVKTMGEVGQFAWKQIALAVKTFGDAILDVVNENLPELQQTIITVAAGIKQIADSLGDSFTLGFDDNGLLGGIQATIEGLTGFDASPLEIPLVWGGVPSLLDLVLPKPDPILVPISFGPSDDISGPALDLGVQTEQLTRFQNLLNNLGVPDNVLSSVGNLQESWGELIAVVEPFLGDLSNFSLPEISFGDIAKDIDAVTAAVDWLKNGVQVVTSLVQGDFSGAWQAAADAIGNIGDFFNASFDFEQPQWISDLLGASFEWPPFPEFDFEWPTYPTFDFEWPTFPEFKWPTLPTFKWPSLPTFKWPSFPAFHWPAFHWPAFPAFRWPALPTLNLNILGNAAGTDFSPGGLRLVGERGPEVVQMPAGARVINASRTREMRNEMGGNNTPITIVINESSTPRETASAVQSVLSRARSKGIR